MWFSLHVCAAFVKECREHVPDIVVTLTNESTLLTGECMERVEAMHTCAVRG